MVGCSWVDFPLADTSDAVRRIAAWTTDAVRPINAIGGSVDCPGGDAPHGSVGVVVARELSSF